MPIALHVAPHVASALRRLPELADLPITLLGSGSAHVAFDVGGRYVARFPRDVTADLAPEARLLSRLAPCLPIPVPRYIHADARLAIYEKLPGTPALGVPVTPGVARHVGAFLRALHDVDRDACPELPVDHDPTLGDWASEAMDELDTILDLVGDRWRARLAARPPGDVALRPIHGDFAAEHILLDDGAATGIIDWSDAAVGDPARDLAGLVHWGGEEALDHALQAYGAVDAATRERARWYAMCRGISDVAFGLDEGKPEYVTAGLAALDRLSP